MQSAKVLLIRARRRFFSLRFAVSLPELTERTFAPLPGSSVLRSVLRACVSDEYYSSKSLLAKEGKLTILESTIQADIYSLANSFLEDMVSIGTYTHPFGSLAAREKLAAFFALRDGASADVNRICLTEGPTQAMQMIFACLRTVGGEAVLLESPCLSSSVSIARTMGFETILVETAQSSNSIIEKFLMACGEARSRGLRPKVFFLSHPQKFSGRVFTPAEMTELLCAAGKEEVTLLVDESGQEQPCSDQPFVSFDGLPAQEPVITFLSTCDALLPEPSCPGALLRFSKVSDAVFEIFARMFALYICASPLSQISLALSYGTKALETNLNADTQRRLVEERARNLKQVSEGHDILKNFFTSAGMETFPSPFGSRTWVKHLLPVKILQKYSSPHEALQKYCDDIFFSTGIEAIPGNLLNNSSDFICFSKVFELRDRIPQVLTDVHARFLS